MSKEPEVFTVKLNKEKIFNFKLHPESNKLRTFLVDLPRPTVEFEAIMHKIIEKFDCRRLYLIAEKNNLRDYEALGFQKVQIDISELKADSEHEVMVYDKTRNYEDPSFKKVPDLIVIDGGKGQLSHAVKAMEDHQLVIPIISLAKKEEEIYIPGQSEPFKLENTDKTRLMIQHLRDEAHRFAIEYNRKLRKNDYTSSQLEEIPGIGKLLAQKLLKKFGSVENMKNSSETEISAIVGRKNAIKIKSTLN